MKGELMKFFKKSSFIIVPATLMVVCLFFAVGIYAGTKADDVIKMENKAYSKHKKSIVTFSHKKHTTDYKLGCGECHHDENHKPLSNLKEGDNVKNCIDCHKKPGYITGKSAKAKGLSKSQKLEYHANAIHDNCKGCHKKFNKEKGLKSAPTTCTKCHPKKAK